MDRHRTVPTAPTIPMRLRLMEAVRLSIAGVERLIAQCAGALISQDMAMRHTPIVAARILVASVALLVDVMSPAHPISTVIATATVISVISVISVTSTASRIAISIVTVTAPASHMALPRTAGVACHQLDLHTERAIAPATGVALVAAAARMALARGASHAALAAMAHSTPTRLVAPKTRAVTPRIAIATPIVMATTATVIIATVTTVQHCARLARLPSRAWWM